MYFRLQIYAYAINTNLFEKENLIMEDEKNVLEKWLEYREEELECGLSKEDKKHIIAFDKF